MDSWVYCGIGCLLCLFFGCLVGHSYGYRAAGVDCDYWTRAIAIYRGQRHRAEELQEAYREEGQKLRKAIRAAGFEIMQTSGDWSIHDVSQLAEAEWQKTLTILNQNTDLQQAVQAKDDALRDAISRLSGNTQLQQHALAIQVPEVDV